MTNLSGSLLTIILVVGYGFFAPRMPLEPAAATPQPPMVCSTVDRLNVRTGPGTQYEVVAGMVYGQCAPRLETSTDGDWLRVDEGWVSAQFTEIQANAAAPTAAATAQPLPTKTREAVLAATLQPTEVMQPVSRVDAKRPGQPVTVTLKNWFTANPLKAMLNTTALKNWAVSHPLNAGMLFLCLYLGLVSAQKFKTGRLVLNGFLSLLMAAAAALMWNYFMRSAFVGNNPSIQPISVSSMLGPALGGYAAGVLLGKEIYRGPRDAERGADTHCAVCSQKQRRDRMSTCPTCGKPYCNFLMWNHSSIRGKVDGIAIVIAFVLGFFLTAISIFGGIIILATLSLPYLLLRELLPDNQRPSYWKNCGSSAMCSTCAAKLAPAVSSSGSSSSSDYDYGSSSDNDYSSSYDDRYDRDYDTKDDSDDDDKRGSGWDGWLVKW